MSEEHLLVEKSGHVLIARMNRPEAKNAFSPNMLGIAGGSQPHTNQQPYLAMNFCIALQGVFPARN